MDDLMMLLLEAQQKRRVTASSWLASVFLGLIAALLVTLFGRDIPLFFWFGAISAVVFGVTLIVSIVMHCRSYWDEW